MFKAVPVNSVDAHDEGLHVGVGGTAELAAGLSAERGAVTQREMVQRADGAAVSHHWSEGRRDGGWGRGKMSVTHAAGQRGEKTRRGFRLWPRLFCLSPSHSPQPPPDSACISAS